MKTMKRLFATVLAVMMAFCLSVPAFADQTVDVDTGEGTITIENANKGQTYVIYKVFDATNSGSNVAYTYTKSGDSDALYNVLAGSTSPFTLTATTTSNVYNVALATGKGITDVVSFFKTNVSLLTATKSAACTDSPMVFDDVAYGYYYITTTTGTLVAINSAAANAEVKDKNDLPTVDKEVKEDSTSKYGETNTAGIGDTVEYQVTITAKEGAENYVLHDTMTEGLTFNSSSVKVKVGKTALTLGTDYTVNTTTTDGCTFEVVFTQTYLDKITSSGATIVVTYSATVNSNAKIDSNENTNTAELKYGENNDLTTGKKKTVTYVYDFEVFKYYTTTDEDSSTTTQNALAGAKFVLYKTVDGTTYYAVVADGKLTGWTPTKTEATTLESDANGKISVEGLDAGTYHLEETEAPAGYNKLEKVVDFVIAENGTVKMNDTVVSYVGIENKAGSQLPSTGGMGTTLFYVIGGIMVAGAAVLLVTKKRMND